MATVERTYQGLAWEPNARVEMTAEDWQRAEAYIRRALSTIKGYEVPPKQAGKFMEPQPSSVHVHESMNQPNIIGKSAGRQFPNWRTPSNRRRPLRTTFLSTPAIRKILGDTETTHVHFKSSARVME
jgi:hypothetical protein